MGVDVFAPGDESRLGRMGLDNPATTITPNGAFDNFFSALGQGVVGGAAAVGRVAGDALAQVGKSELMTSYAQNPNTTDAQWQEVQNMQPVAPFDESLKAVQTWAKLDARTTGVAAMTAGNVARGLTIFGMGSLLGGPEVGAATLGVTEGYGNYRDLTAAGVDAKTAGASALLTGSGAALGAYLPMKMTGSLAKGVLGLAMQAEAEGAGALASSLYTASSIAARAAGSMTANLAYGASINVGFGMASRALTSRVLDAGGYPEMARQYEAMDGEAVAADAILGLAFGGVAHLHETMTNRPTADLVEKALEVRREEQINRGAAGIPTDPMTAHLDRELQDRALNELLQGKDPEVSSTEAHAIVDGALADPEKVKLHEDLSTASRDAYGPLVETAEPEMRPVVTEPYDVPEPKVESATPATEATVKLDPVVEEQLRQISERHPDMEVQMPDGTTIKASQLEEKLRQNLALAESESKLHDVAVACFLRTL